MDELDELLSLIDAVSERIEELDPSLLAPGGPEVDPTALAGPSGQAQENRAISISRARSAAERARATRAALPDLVARAKSTGERLRAFHGPTARPAAGRHDAILDALDAATREVRSNEGSQAALDRVVTGAVAGLPGVERATVSLRRQDGAIVISAASDETAATLMAAQTDLGEGPCLEAVRLREVVGVPDLATADDRWPRFARLADELGAHALLSLPLTCGSRHGCLTFYAAEPAAFDDSTLLVGELFARHAAVALGGAERIDALNRAVDSRDEIGQAKGILMVRHRLDADGAFQLLVRSSQDTNLKLVEVARWVVANLAERTHDAGAATASADVPGAAGVDRRVE